ncbi:hypothetical protein WBJ53_26275 [Spirosoma sp. SC4-14]
MKIRRRNHAKLKEEKAEAERIRREIREWYRLELRLLSQAFL